MRRSVRAHSHVDGEARLARAVAGLPEPARRALATVADREDLPLVAGAWQRGDGGCLVANVVGALGGADQAQAGTLDVRVLELLPELSSRDLNRLIVAWDEAALGLVRGDDPALRGLLRRALGRAGAERRPAGVGM